MSKNKSNKNKKQKNSTSKNTTPSATANTQKQPQIIPQKSFTITVKMLSDWHIGCGAGRTGDIDSLVQRDQDGFPYIPAKTLTGIWRDACELIALGLDNGNEDGAWKKWLDYLFGEQPSIAKQVIEASPRSAALSIRAAFLPVNLRTALKDKPHLKEALSFVKPGIQIDAESGCAKEDFLRFEEMVRGGTILEAKCEFNLPKDEYQRRVAYALLIAGSKLLERLGGKRRRGAGKCQLVINKNTYQEENIQDWIDWLEANQEAPCVPESDEDSNTNNEQYTQTENDSWLQCPLTITTKSPLIISKRTVGNITETLDYIPGTHLLRLVIRKLAHLGVNLSSAIACGDILITNATLEVDGQQGRPVPLALFYEKLGGGIEKDGAVYNRFLEFPSGDKQLKGYRGGYIGSTNQSNLPKYAKANLIIGTHNTIEDEYQRPTSDVGGVYSYQAIQPGTKLQAELRLRRSLAEQLSKKQKKWWDCLKGEDSLGQSKKDDYGAVHIEIATPKKDEIKIENNQGKLTVWLFSDVLIRDERLRPSTSIDDFRKELEKHLSVKFEIQGEEGEKLSLIARQNRIDSWQVRWGLPRPSLVGLAAGTCVVFQIKDYEKIEPSTLTELTSKLVEIEASGIGERRAEGYGQICFNDPILTTTISNLNNTNQDNKSQSLSSSSNLSKQLIFPSDRAFSYARIIEKAAWREAIRRAVLKIAAMPENRFGIKANQPTMSQLGAFRSILGQLHQPEVGQLGYVTKWLNSLEDTPNRKEKWSPQTLKEIRALISNENHIWSILNLDFASITLTSNGQRDLQGGQFRNMKNEEWKQSDQLWTETVQIFVDACIRAHKRDLEKEDLNLAVAEGVESHGA
jgi:CRISPR-associated protein Csx10